MFNPEEAAARARRKDRMRRPHNAKIYFLDHLAETYDVDGACAAAGLPWIDMCQLRDEDPDFAAEWERVIAAGYERIEIMLLQLGGAAGAVEDREPDLVIARELVRGRAARRRRSGAAGSPPKPNREARIASIIRKITRARSQARQKDNRDEAEAPVEAVVGGAAEADGGRPQGPDG